MLEDGPQFVIQMINSFLVGTSWTWVQVASPFLSLMGLTGRLIVRDDEFFFKFALTCTQLTCVVPVLIMVICIFSYEDKRPSWAAQFSSVRYTHNDDKNPYIV